MTRTLRIGTRGSAARAGPGELGRRPPRRARRPHRDHDHPHRGRRPAGRHRLGRGRVRRPDRGGAARRASVDLAVHSAKDVPTDEHPHLVIAAYPPREDPRDALVCRERGTTLATLPDRRARRHRQPAPGRVPAGRPPRPRDPPAPRQRGHPPRQAGPRRLRRARARGRRSHAPRPRRPDRRHPPVRRRRRRPRARASLALQVRDRRRGGDRRRRPARRSRDARRRPGRARAAQRDRRRLPLADRGARDGWPTAASSSSPRAERDVDAGARRDADRRARSPGSAGPPPSPTTVALAARLAARIVTLRQRPRVLVGRPDAQAGSLLDALDEAGRGGRQRPGDRDRPGARGRRPRRRAPRPPATATASSSRA